MARVLVTGARRGIGSATVIELARRGHRVIGGVRRSEHVEDLRALGEGTGETVEAVVLDVSDPASIAAAAEEVMADGILDVVVNNAAILPCIADVLELPEPPLRTVYPPELAGLIAAAPRIRDEDHLDQCRATTAREWSRALRRSLGG